MTQEEQKNLLIKDLCARLSHGVKLQHVKNADSIVELYSIDLDDFYYKIKFYTYKGKALTVSDESKLLRPGGILRYKPYLFPLSSMTEEQKRDLTNLFNCTVVITEWEIVFPNYYDSNMDNWNKVFNWCYKNHFDINGLIPMGLAIDATNLNIY